MYNMWKSVLNDSEIYCVQIEKKCAQCCMHLQNWMTTCVQIGYVSNMAIGI